MSFNSDADDAIEAWAKKHRAGFSDHKWHRKKSGADWQYTPISWEAEMDKIQRNFEALIGFPIPFTGHEKRASTTLIMDDIAYALVRKAETQATKLGKKTILKALRK